MRKSNPPFYSKAIDFIVSHLVAFSGYMFFKICCKGEIFNSDEIDKTIADNDLFIIAMNHESYLDWIIIWALFKYKYKINIIFLAKEKLFNHLLWGRIVRFSQCICVSDDGKKIIDKAGKRRLDNSIIGIFPEGTRSRNGKLLEFKAGVALIAAKQNIPILPITLNGFFEAWKPESRFPKFSKMKIVVNQLIENDDTYRVKDYLALTKERIALGKDIVNLKGENFSSAIFDLDFTLLKTNIADLLFYMHKKRKSRFSYILWLMKISPLIPVLKVIDEFYRPLTQLIIFKMYSNFSKEMISEDCEEYMQLYFKEKIIEKSIGIMKVFQNDGLKTHILSTNLQIFVDSVAKRTNAKGTGVSLNILQSLNFLDKLKYLKNFKQNNLKVINYKNFIGIGDSIYDTPIFKNSSYSIKINSNNKRKKISQMVNNYIDI